MAEIKKKQQIPLYSKMLQSKVDSLLFLSKYKYFQSTKLLIYVKYKSPTNNYLQSY